MRRRRLAIAQARYFFALARKFRITLLLALLVLVGGSALVHLFYRHGSETLTFGQAFGAVYFLMIGNPNVSWPDPVWLQIFFVMLPPLGLVVLADGLIRFAYLFFAKRENAREWIQVQASVMKDHVILVGMGTVGFRVLRRLRELGVDVVVIEKDDNGRFVKQVRALDRRDDGMVLFVDDARGDGVLHDAGVERARALIACTDDDLANLDVALDARAANPAIKLVCRFWDDKLADRAAALGIHAAYSSTALAAPVFALAAIDEGVIYSFMLPGEEELQVVGEVKVPPGQAGRSAKSIHDEFGLFVVRVRRADRSQVPRPDTALAEGDYVVAQGGLAAFRRLCATMCLPRPGAA